MRWLEIINAHNLPLMLSHYDVLFEQNLPNTWLMTLFGKDTGEIINISVLNNCFHCLLFWCLQLTFDARESYHERSHLHGMNGEIY